MQEEHKRRVHYSGKYPKKFEEKYKERDPEKYADTVAHVIEKGSTPAGMHISIMVNEILNFLQIKPGQTGLDATLGYGGHTKRMLEVLTAADTEEPMHMAADTEAPMHTAAETEVQMKTAKSGGTGSAEKQGRAGCLVGLDVDPIESAKTVERLRSAGYGEDVFRFRLTNFRNIDRVAEELGPFDFVLADLGVSSMQLDDPSRGFSYKTDGPLDLRMNPQTGSSAAQRLREISMHEFAGMLIENSDEPYAEEIAEKVFFRMQKGAAMDTTQELREAIEAALIKPTNGMSKEEKAEAVKKSCRRTFQALRIDVNSEFEVLYEFLDKLPDVLKPGGRAAILTFHSGEDRLVKRSFKELHSRGIYSEISGDVIRPSAEECRSNGRARSTKMRWAIKA